MEIPTTPPAGPGSGHASCDSSLVCPVCRCRLAGAGRSLRCARGHTFDRAREGYVDLLPTGYGRSKIQGDTAEMVRARRRFLERGHYAPLSRRIGEIALEHLGGGAGSGETAGRRAVLEAGCGSGYYVGELVRHLEATRPGAADCFFGLDVSKAAVRAAARAYPRVLFFVNDVKHRICLGDASVDLLLDVFSPRNPEEFARVARRDALLVVVIPTGRHLGELREHVPILSIEAGKRDRIVDSLRGAFDLEGEEVLEYGVELDGDTIADLLRMTPSAWHLEEAELSRAAALPRLPVTIGFSVLRFRRIGEAEK